MQNRCKNERYEYINDVGAHVIVFGRRDMAEAIITPVDLVSEDTIKRLEAKEK